MTADLVMPAFFSPEVSDIIAQFLQRGPEARLQEESVIRSVSGYCDLFSSIELILGLLISIGTNS